MDWSAIIVGALGAVAMAWTAWSALRAKRDEIEGHRMVADRPDWAAFSRTLETRVERQDHKIDELFDRVEQLRQEVRKEQRVTAIVLRYLREVLAWAIPLVPEGHEPPHPPAEISDELRYWLEAK